MDLVQYNCAEQLIMASKARLFGDDTALSAILDNKNISGVKYVTFTLHCGKTNAKLSSFAAT